MQFVGHMKKFARAVIDDKEKLSLMNMTEFDPSIDPGGYRRQNNFKRAYGLILDFDGGKLSPEEFERIFWHDAKKGEKVAFVICNTFSRSAADPNRYRVFIPFRTRAMSLDAFQATYDTIVERLADSGYAEADAKLDQRCRSGIQPFYIPSTNRAHKEWAYFKVHGLDRMRDFERYALKPTTIPDVAPSPPQPEVQPIRIMPSRNSPIDQAWRKDGRVLELQSEIRSMSEERHDPFFAMAVSLRSMGYSMEVIEEILYDTQVKEVKTRGTRGRCSGRLLTSCDRCGGTTMRHHHPHRHRIPIASLLSRSSGKMTGSLITISRCPASYSLMAFAAYLDLPRDQYLDPHLHDRWGASPMDRVWSPVRWPAAASGSRGGRWQDAEAARPRTDGGKGGGSVPFATGDPIHIFRDGGWGKYFVDVRAGSSATTQMAA
jgi:hypothetical protein